jgi:very-short-patch-repair endonuclease
VIEIDRDSHEERLAYDQKRATILSKFRCKVIRFTNQQVHDDIEKVLSEIEKALSE